MKLSSYNNLPQHGNCHTKFFSQNHSPLQSAALPIPTTVSLAQLHIQKSSASPHLLQVLQHIFCIHFSGRFTVYVRLYVVHLLTKKIVIIVKGTALRDFLTLVCPVWVPFGLLFLKQKYYQNFCQFAKITLIDYTRFFGVLL